MKVIEKLEDIVQDPRNANAGTLRGEQLLEHSLVQYGAGRSIVVDKNGVALAGNKTLQLAIEAGLGVRVVPSDGTTLVAVMRTDLDLAESPSARMLAYLDNRTAEVGLSWDPAQLAADLASGLALGGLFTEAERQAALAGLTQATVPDPPLQSTVLFATASHRAAWLAAVMAYPGATTAERVVAWATEHLTHLP